mmetsp:Transcript_30616/g.50563  ORF Transcript_30616/g.50563 Transcript_30616/m.50563 type:complete len:132 (-) Transcript_30616:109-504(-)|eukprot:CAMPEP_0119011884 /NCGR_PEP_ID=MMETSP1176-20130426/5946_1 /TAXON_ID=265551 /ORGANISM="Synedropsis recta cf, Strain CCMP1620" /LENGTH=131 /DNA_ID=CAMNT_0006964761 /DNA_START=101 /DNA_END=496 /DNA_ORIENTATION=+
MALGNKALKRREQAADAKAGVTRNSIDLRKLASAKPEMFCAVCKQMFLLTKKNAEAKRHHEGKHPKVALFSECFPEIAKIEADLLAEEAEAAKKPAPTAAAKKPKKKEMDLDLLSAGITTKKKAGGNKFKK